MNHDEEQSFYEAVSDVLFKVFLAFLLIAALAIFEEGKVYLGFASVMLGGLSLILSGIYQRRID